MLGVEPRTSCMSVHYTNWSCESEGVEVYPIISHLALANEFYQFGK